MWLKMVLAGLVALVTLLVAPAVAPLDVTIGPISITGSTSDVRPSHVPVDCFDRVV